MSIISTHKFCQIPTSSPRKAGELPTFFVDLNNNGERDKADYQHTSITRDAWGTGYTDYVAKEFCEPTLNFTTLTSLCKEAKEAENHILPESSLPESFVTSAKETLGREGQLMPWNSLGFQFSNNQMAIVVLD